MLLHALNYGRLGLPGLRRRTLLSHLIVFLLFLCAKLFTRLPTGILWVIGLYYVFHFWKSQDSLYKEHLRTKGTSASLVVPATLSAVAFGLVLVVMVVGYGAWWDAYFDKGVALIDEGRFHAAEKIFLRISEEFGDDKPYAYWNLAVIRAERGDLPGAIRSMRKMVDLEPQDAEAARYFDELKAGVDFERGVALLEEGELDEAEATFLRYLRVIPNDMNAYWNLAVVRGHAGNLSGAIEAMVKAVRLDPQNVEIKDYLAQLRVRDGFARAIDASQLDEAEKLIRKYLEAYPADAYVFAHLATIRLVQGRLAEAINIADKALEMDPESDELREFLERIIEDAPK